MSRSHKRPYVTDQQSSRGSARVAKRNANRAVRHAKEVADGKSYRKHSCTWDIRDWSFYDTSPKARRK